MKLFSKLLCGAAIAASAATAGTAEMFMTVEDNAVIRLVRTANSDGTFSAHMESPNPSLMEIETQNCFSSAFGGGCNGTLLLKKDGPVNLDGVPFSTEAPYQKAEITSPTLDIDLTPGSIFENTAIQVHEGITEPSTTPNVPQVFKPFNQAFIETIVSAVEEDFIRLSYTTSTADAFPAGVTTLYQDHYYIGAATRLPVDLELVDANGQLVNAGYESHTTNKGHTLNVNQFVNAVAWDLFGWSTSGGHFAEWRFFTNGTSKFDTGLDLSGYSSIEFTMNCTNGMVVEAFFGTGDDSSQSHIGDFNCSNGTQTFSFNIANSPNASDIQTALWLHIPTWKNPGLGQQDWLFMRMENLVIKK